MKSALFATAKALGLFALCRRLTRGVPRILCYHGGCLGDESRFNPKLFCDAGHLETRLRWLKAMNFQPVTLDEALEAQSATGGFEGLPVVVTLDDGWYSSATELIPLLHRYGFPCTLYLATAVFVSGRPVVDVAVGYLLWKTPRTAVTIDGLGSELDGCYVIQRAHDRQRLASLAQQWILGNGDEAAEVTRRLQRFASQLGVEPQTLDLQSRRFNYMNAIELMHVVAQGCSIQLHGHAHHYPVGQPLALAADIERCAEVIVGQGLPTPRHYCYPSGDHDEMAPGVLRKLGVASATTCLPIASMRRAVAPQGPYCLPRFLDGPSVSMLEFEAELSGFSWLLRSLRSNLMALLRGRRPATV